jgi:hypothetical protein
MELSIKICFSIACSPLNNFRGYSRVYSRVRPRRVKNREIQLKSNERVEANTQLYRKKNGRIDSLLNEKHALRFRLTHSTFSHPSVPLVQGEARWLRVIHSWIHVTQTSTNCIQLRIVPLHSLVGYSPICAHTNLWSAEGYSAGGQVQMCLSVAY